MELVKTNLYAIYTTKQGPTKQCVYIASKSLNRAIEIFESLPIEETNSLEIIKVEKIDVIHYENRKCDQSNLS